MIRLVDILSAVGAMAMAATPLVAIGSSAHAAELGSPSKTIIVGDLDFGRPGDVARFDARVMSAAGAICADRGRTDLNQWSACRSAVREEAIQRLHALQQGRSEELAASRNRPCTPVRIKVSRHACFESRANASSA